METDSSNVLSRDEGTSNYGGLSPDEKDDILLLQQCILESVVRGFDHRDILDQLCELEEKLLPNSVASIMLLDEQELLNVYAAPNIPTHGIAQLNGLRPGPGAGSCGNAVYCQAPVFVADTLTDPKWRDLRKIAIDFGLMACWSMPIRSSGQKVVGTFALSSFEGRSPSPFHIKLLEIGASIAGIVLERSKQQDSLRLLDKVFDDSREGIIVTDAEQRIVSVNRSFTKITGYSMEEAFGKTPSLLSSGHHDEHFYRNMWRNLNRFGHWQGEIWNRRSNGEIYPEWLSISAVLDSEGQPSNYVGFFSDISERKAVEARMEFLAFHDALTGLPNRTQARNHFEQAMAFAHRAQAKLALLFLDLDNFKTINDSLGHEVGDILLKKLASMLQSATRETDSVSRYGGDEFLIQLSNARDSDTITDITEKILLHLAKPFDVGGYELSTSFSIGIAIYPDDGRDFDTLLKKANTAMYKAKEAGRNTYRFYTEQMNIDALEHLKLLNGLRRALENGEFTLHYQPQMEIGSGRIVGAEALIRWNHPEFGIIPPSRFIPIAEESGLIVQIGEWVLREACRTAAGWGNLAVAVNLSAIQFRQANLVETVFRAIEDFGLDPSLLELELTESVLLQDSRNVMAAIQQLKKNGIKLAIDDFGTGYSSLSYLKRLEVDKLKIDRSFVKEMADNPNDAAIVAAIVQMAASLKLKTIAEGVEDEKTLEALRTLRCDEMQGYLFSRPLPQDELEALLAAG